MATTDFAVLDELIHHRAGHVRRNRETNADAAAGFTRQNLRIDSDKFADRIYQGAAGVAMIDRCISLQEIFEAARSGAAGRAALRADNAHRHRLPNTERITNRQRYIADSHFVRIAGRHVSQARGVHFQQCQIARRIGSD